MNKSDYLVFRGKCKKACEALKQVLPELKLVRGYVILGDGTEEPHWWLKSPEGTVVDPTEAQFNSPIAIYTEFNGSIRCEQCGEVIPEKDAIEVNNRAVCSGKCAMRLMGLS